MKNGFDSAMSCHLTGSIATRKKSSRLKYSKNQYQMKAMSVIN